MKGWFINKFESEDEASEGAKKKAGKEEASKEKEDHFTKEERKTFN